MEMFKLSVLLLCLIGTTEAQFFVQLANWLANGIAQSSNQNAPIPQSALNFQGQPVAPPSPVPQANPPVQFVAQPQPPVPAADVSLLQANPNVVSFLNSGNGPTLIPTLPPTIITAERLATAAERFSPPPTLLSPTGDSGITSQFAAEVQPKVIPEYLNRQAQNYSDNVQSVLNKLGYMQTVSTPPLALPTAPVIRRINHFPPTGGPTFLSTQSSHFRNVLQRLGLNQNVQPPSFGAPGADVIPLATPTDNTKLPASVIVAAPQLTTWRPAVSADRVITFPPVTTPVVTTARSLTQLEIAQQRAVLEEQIKRLRQMENDRLAVEKSLTEAEVVRVVTKSAINGSILSPTDSTKTFTRAQDFEFAQLPQLAPISSGPERTLAEKLGVKTTNDWLIPYKPSEGR